MLKNRNQPQTKEAAEETTTMHKVLTVIGTVMCVILIPLLIINCTLIVKSFINKDKVPDFGGYLPLIVLTDSMYPDIKRGDLIFCKTAEAEDINEEDVISFFDPAGNGTAVVTHKVTEIVHENGKIFFRTKGIANNAEDRMLVPEENLVGRYTDFRLPGVGSAAYFMQTTEGLIVCVLIPMIALVGYDILRRKLYEKSKGEDMNVLMAELESLKAEKAAKENAALEDEKAALLAELAALKAEKAAAQKPQEAPEETEAQNSPGPDEAGEDNGVTKDENSSDT